MLRYVLFIRQDLTKVDRIVVFLLDHPSVLFEVSPIIYLLSLGGESILCSGSLIAEGSFGKVTGGFRRCDGAEVAFKVEWCF
jgi:hypothetical protein